MSLIDWMRVRVASAAAAAHSATSAEQSRGAKASKKK